MQKKEAKEILNKIEVIGINSKQEYGIDLEKVNEAIKILVK